MVLILTNQMLSNVSNVGDIEWFVSSITQISSIALEASSSDEIEGEIDEDDKDKAQVKREKDEVEHDEIEENILRQSQQVVHGGQISGNISQISRCWGLEDNQSVSTIKAPTATADFSPRPAMIQLQQDSSGRLNWPFAAETESDRQTGQG